MATGFKTRFWCSQDLERKKKSHPSEKEGAKHRDTVGMKRFNCSSCLRITCREEPNHPGTRLVKIYLKHSGPHVPYYDVAMPPEAAAIIRQDVEHHSPAELVLKIQNRFPAITRAQVHAAWTTMSETIWKRDKVQLTSARKLLDEYATEVDVFNLPTMDGIEQLAWGMRKIAGRLRGIIAEVGIDATCKWLSVRHKRSILTSPFKDNTNSKHLELYTVLAENDNAGFPVSYCLLSTASSIDSRKRRKAIEWWLRALRDKYELHPPFIHVDKDFAEIGASLEVWPNAKIQLCFWHMRDAVTKRVRKAKISTTPYDLDRARQEYPFISKIFLPRGRGDASDGDDGHLDEPEEHNVSAHVGDNPNAVFLRIPNPSQHVNTRLANMTNSSEVPKPLFIRIPAQKPDESGTQYKFCPDELRDPLVELMEHHFCAHPLIPGYSAPNPQGIKAWAVKQAYEFCTKNDLPDLWAYLWENWYRKGRWELWARANHLEIPRLRTTMIVESQ
jgi:hypothetical protein